MKSRAIGFFPLAGTFFTPAHQSFDRARRPFPFGEVKNVSPSGKTTSTNLCFQNSLPIPARERRFNACCVKLLCYLDIRYQASHAIA
jgi:hypothetical protein